MAVIKWLVWHFAFSFAWLAHWPIVTIGGVGFALCEVAKLLANLTMRFLRWANRWANWG